MRRIGVLGNSDSWYLADLIRAAGPRDVEIFPLDFERLGGTLGRACSTRAVFAGDVSLEDLDALIVRSMPPGSLEQIILRMDLLQAVERSGIPLINPPRAMELAIDKYLCLARLAAAGVLVPETIVCQTWQDGVAAYEQLGPHTVVKPLFGSEGRGIMRVDDPELAHRVFKTLQRSGSVIYVQKFIDHPGHDLRVLLLGEKLWGMRRSSDSDWRTNLSRGGTATLAEVPAELAEIVRRIGTTWELPFAGFDFLPDRDGNCYLLEVNGVPGWRGLAGAHGVDIAGELLDYVLSVVERRVGG